MFPFYRYVSNSCVRSPKLEIQVTLTLAFRHVYGSVVYKVLGGLSRNLPRNQTAFWRKSQS